MLTYADVQWRWLQELTQVSVSVRRATAASTATKLSELLLPHTATNLLQELTQASTYMYIYIYVYMNLSSYC